MKLKPYPEYKDSGVEWIGNIPSNWDLVRNKNIFSKSKKIVGDKWEDYPVLSLTKKGVIIRDIESNEGKMPSDFSIYQIVRPNNLLLCLFDIDVTPRCVGYINNKGIVSAAYSEIAPKTDINTKYYYYWYLMLDFDKQLLHLSKNLRNSLSNEDFMALPIVKPTIDEQKRISSFLDKKTSEIDLTVEKYRRLIELLREKRTALINHVVTKGLDPTAEMKDSGVEWIGEIPEEWEVRRLKHISLFSSDKLNKKPKELPYIGLEHIQSGNGVLLENNVEEVDSNVCRFKKGDILFGKLRPYLAKVIEAPFDGVGTTELVVIRMNESINSRYAFYQLLSNRFINLVNALTYGVKMPRASPDQIANISICVPSIKEQKEISLFLDKETSKIDSIIQKIQNNIGLLEEYKKSLIHHVVTGKVDVRGVVV